MTHVVVINEIRNGMTQKLSLLQNVSLVIKSEGGSVLEALLLREHIRRSGISVLFDGLCSSAAQYLLGASENEVITPRSKGTVHRPTTVGENGKAFFPQHLRAQEVWALMSKFTNGNMSELDHTGLRQLSAKLRHSLH